MANYTSINIKGKVISLHNQRPLPYASIGVKNKSIGSISDLSGNFQMTKLNAADTLVFSYLGYETFSIPVAKIKDSILVQLKIKATQLAEVEIKSDWSFLYELILASKKHNHQKSIKAKTYFQLLSTLEQKEVEFVEGHYNANLLAHDVKDLALKNGRIVLIPFQNRIWASTESSKAIYLHQLFNSSDYFPSSPLALNKRQLKKQFDVNLDYGYIDEKQNKIYVIELIPKEKPYNFFKTKVWINAENHRLLKVEMDCKSTAKHPFLPLGNIKSIESVALKINKQFKEIDNLQYLESVDFIYTINYLTQQGTALQSNTTCILKAYDYTNSFHLPLFEFAGNEVSDYRRINAAPYNAFFWNSSLLLQRTDMELLYHNLAQEDSAITQNQLFRNNTHFTKGFFESPYIHWSKNRIRIKPEKSHFANKHHKMSSAQSDMIQLKAQIYLDVNCNDDSLNILTATVFDPFNSYYKYPLDGKGLAFINIYFDLVEISRQELMKKIATVKDIDLIYSSYHQANALLQEELKNYQQDVQRGLDTEGLREWNNYVYKHLGIDNMKIFQVLDQ